MYDSSGKLPGILAFVELSHEQHIRTALSECKDSSIPVPAEYGVHLEVSKTFPVCFPGTLAYAYTVRDGHPLSPDGPCPMFKPVPAVLVQRASFGLVPAYNAVYCFVRDVFPLPGKISGYLCRRPLLLREKSYRLILHVRRYAVIARMPALVIHGITLSRFPVVTAITSAIALQFA